MTSTPGAVESLYIYSIHILKTLPAVPNTYVCTWSCRAMYKSSSELGTPLKDRWLCPSRFHYREVPLYAEDVSVIMTY